MFIKKGVSIAGLRPEMVVALLMLEAVTWNDFVLTSGTEPAPGRVPTSLHPRGLAIDVRIPTAESENWLDSSSLSESDRPCPSWRARVQAAFADTDFDLVWYDTHVHIEFDPKSADGSDELVPVREADSVEDAHGVVRRADIKLVA